MESSIDQVILSLFEEFPEKPKHHSTLEARQNFINEIRHRRTQQHINQGKNTCTLQ